MGRRRPRADRVPERAAAGPRDRPLRRPADLQLRLAGRRRLRRDHARDPRRGPRLEHADADQHPARARRRPARLRARSEHQRRRRPQALEAPRNAVALDDFRDAGYLPAALLNFLALLGWSYDDKTTIMSRHELVERFDLDRVVPSPATFDYKKLDWLNGVYLRNLQPDEYAHWLCKWLARAGHRLARGAGARDGAARAGEDREVLAVPRLRPLPVRGRRAPTAPIRGSVAPHHERLEPVEPWEATRARGGAAGARRRARREAAHGVPADPARDHRLEGLTGAVREPRAARQGGVARRLAAAAQALRPEGRATDAQTASSPSGPHRPECQSRRRRRRRALRRGRAGRRDERPCRGRS